MPAIADEPAAARGVVNVAVEAWPGETGQQQFAIGGEAETAGPAAIPDERFQEPARQTVPQPDLSGTVSRGDAAVRGYGKAIDFIVMACHGLQQSAVVNPPQPQLAIQGASHGSRAI